MASRVLKSIVTAQALRPALLSVARSSNFAATATVAWRHPAVLTSTRFYAKKGKDNKKKNNNAESKAVSESGSEDFDFQFSEKEIQGRFEQSISQLKEHLSSMRIGRANPSLLDNVRVRIEGSHFALKDLAQVTIRDPQTLMVTVHDSDYAAAVDKSIREAGLNLNPIVDSKGIKVPIPKPSRESRDKMAKLVSTTGEQTKTRIRSIRQDGLKQLKHDLKHQPADENNKLTKLVQNLVDKSNKTVDELLKAKIKELQS